VRRISFLVTGRREFMRYPGLIVLLAVVFVAISSSSAVAQVGIYWPAQILEEKQLVVGANLVFGSAGVMGQARYGITESVDASPKIGFLREAKTTFFYIGGDFRYGVMQESLGDELDLSVLGSFSVFNGANHTRFLLGVGPQFGRTFSIEGSDMIMAPYAGILLGVNHVPNNNDFGGILPIGNQFQFREDIVAHFELDIMFGEGTDVQVGLGINYMY
jgi:hypothetical protein